MSNAATLAALSPPSLDLLERFMSVVEDVRKASPAQEWQDLVKRSRTLREWRFFLAADPYTRWGLVKPRGYPGDATLMDYAYAHPSVRPAIDHAGGVGGAIYACTSGARQSQSARQRVALARGLLALRAATGPQRVMSFAAGHAREFEGLEPPVLDRINRFTPIDNDPASLDVACRSATGVPCSPVRRNVVKDDLSDLQQADLVYSLGLFDYLVEDVAVDVLVRMLRLTAPGGVCMLANLSHDAANLGYCEAIMDWWMVTRDEAAMLALAQAAIARVGDGMQATVEHSGCFLYLMIKR